MNIYAHEFRMNAKSVVSWSIAVFLILLIYMSIFPTMAEDAALLNEVMANFPEEFLMAFGMDGLDMSSVLGFFGITLLFTQICVSIQAANYGFSLVSVEERELTADFLLSKPVGRTSILTSKLLAALSSLAITNVVIWASSFALIRLFNEGSDYDTNTLALLLLTVTFLQLFFLSVGLLVSLLVRRIRNVTPYAMGLVFGLYIINAFGGMIGDDKLTYITPFKHFDANYIVRHAALNLPLAAISVGVIVLAVAGSYTLYARRNIPSVT